ncbi:head-tail adaptor protein [Segnochrobactrum spirostomi]|uniref:Head-tail adaptor protein n=1 Tax=Segnochrobactrum spirostomi TaxID=2608987 RepID=A0A6A7Y086_9HYPH|nr:head-tail adaptor protein [Segnochrobactrum spirostomi]MQT12324.1 head-tail adaptor protein [Segnochrobactrum spirostomi]
MSAGTLALRVRIERAETSADGGGGAVVTWRDIGGAWAALEPLGLSEGESGGRRDGLATHRFRVRRPVDVRGGDRLVAGARLLRVLAVEAPAPGAGYRTGLAEEEGR